VEETRAELNRSLYSLDLTDRLNALEIASMHPAAGGAEPLRAAGQQQSSAALAALSRARSALVAGQQASDPAARAVNVAQARQALAEARARVASSLQSLATATGEPEREGNPPPPAGPPNASAGEGSDPGR
jgi:outer membrane protein TolC